MDFKEVLESIQTTRGLISGLQDGDLIKVAEIGDCYLALRKKLSVHDALKDIAKFVGVLAVLSRKLSDQANQDAVRSILDSSNESLEALFSKQRKGEDVAKEINELVRESFHILKDSEAVDDSAGEPVPAPQAVPGDTVSMDCEPALRLLESIDQLTGLYESGDLMGIVEIKNSYFGLAKLARENGAVEAVIDFIVLLSSVSEKLSDAASEELARELLATGNMTLLEFCSGKSVSVSHIEESIDLVKNFLSKPPETPAQQKPAPVVEKLEYTADYFDNIVNDKKMLGQLADEIREHLDTAQYTLVEFEYDETNQENINKVFRSFHTIKGSSAFLGMKNIEEVGHEMESLLVLVRDGKLRINKELIDVIFFGIELLRSLVGVMETQEFDPAKMKESFVKIDIYSYINLIKKILTQYEVKKIGEILREEGKLTSGEVEHILKRQEETDKKFGTIAIEEKLVSTEDVKDAINRQTAVTKRASYVKVSNERLNTLIDIVGELVINQSMIRQLLETKDESEQAADSVDRVITQLEGITTNIKNLVLSMGMVPIAEVFNKLRVVIRNTSADLGKGIMMDIQGEDTELDRNVVEAIYDPLVHIVRNAVDHGIESPAEREASGKDRIGKIAIIAAHKGNGIEISVRDDGNGVDKNAIIKKAIEKGLYAESDIENLSEKDIYNILFMPGFSTARKVTEVSGRGVGLDVVKKNIDNIHGKVEILSEPGKYTAFIIRLPLTLAIIEGFVVEVKGNKYVLPFNSIEEIIVPEDNAISVMDDGSRMLFNRGVYVPLVSSREVFMMDDEEPETVAAKTALAEQSVIAAPSEEAGTAAETETVAGAESQTAKLNEIAAKTGEDSFRSNDRTLIVIISHEGKSYGIEVDRIIGKQEIVIKNLGESLGNLHIYSGGTIFGDGTIGFVIDIEGFLEKAREFGGQLKKVTA